ncbi:MFS transporter [Tsukamurella soli]|uniref:MFS transporter n=1 Tax=Tsukamurella soli TaxID=644556 RepID=A0ABP8JQM4_9ACTN
MSTLESSVPSSGTARTGRSTRSGLPLLALALGGFGIGTTEFVAMGLLPDIAGDLGVSEPTAGHVIAAYAAGVVVGAPLIATVFARVPRRILLIALMVAFTVGNGLSAVAPSYPLLMAARFLAGLPHGAYFGVAALVAAHLVGPDGRGRAVGRVMLGLSVANVVGVPIATWIGDDLGWRWALALVVVIGIATVAAIAAWLPHVDVPASNPVAELGALRNPQVWFALGTGVVGFGGMFAVYTYLSTTLTTVTGLSQATVPLALAVYGVGMVAGNTAGGVAADRSVSRTLVAGLVAIALVMLAFAGLVHIAAAAFVVVFLVGFTGAGMLPALQTRLMDVAGEAQTLAATMNHSALNIANALGALLGGAVIEAGWGYPATGLVGAVLAVGGLVVVGVGFATARPRTARPPRART